RHLDAFGFRFKLRSCAHANLLSKYPILNVPGLASLVYTHWLISFRRSALETPIDFTPPFGGWDFTRSGFVLSIWILVVRDSMYSRICSSVNLLSFPVTWTHPNFPSRTSLFTVFTLIPRISATSLVLKSF